MQEDALYARLHVLTGVTDEDDVRRLARAVLSVLLEQIEPGDRVLRTLLLADMHAPLQRAQPHAVDDLDTFYQRVAAREGVPIGMALEHAQSVCRALSEQLSTEQRALVVAHLPDVLAQLLALPEPAGAPTPHRSTPGEPGPSHTLADGAPGSRHPLSEAAPAAAHQHSVARNDNPHGDTKLSTSHGATQEREHETLSTGKPGPHERS